MKDFDAERVRKSLEKQAKAMMGKKIVGIRFMSKQEAEEFGWFMGALILSMDDGSTIYSMQDSEGNGPGALFMNGVTFPPIRFR